MTGTASRLVRTRFVTTDPDEALGLVVAAYGEHGLRVHGSREHFLFEHLRDDLGRVRLERVYNSLHTEYRTHAAGNVYIARVLDGAIAVGSTGERRYHRGDVFLVAQPDAGNLTRMDGTRLQVTGMDLPLIAEVTGADPAEVVRRFRDDALPPAAARYWRQTVGFVTAGLPDDPAAAGPLALSSAERLLAAAAVAAFAPDGTAERPCDSSDATPATVRRALAHLEANAGLDLSVADLAAACHVSVRALQLAFRRHLGTTPMARLRRLRLDRARSDLLAADPEDGSTVTEIAARWGFTSPGRFSAQYRTAYGEAPSVTLRR